MLSMYRTDVNKGLQQTNKIGNADLPAVTLEAATEADPARPTPQLEEDHEMESASKLTNASKPQGGQGLVGKMISVYWDDEKKWFRGKVSAFNSSGKHYICYEDGDKEWISLQSQQWKEVSGSCKSSSARLR